MRSSTRTSSALRAAAVVTLGLAVSSCDDLLDSLDTDAGDVGDAADASDDSGADAPDPLVCDSDAIEASLDGLSPLTASYQVEGTDFYRMPWPSDVRLSADGFVDLSDFPRGVPLFQQYVAVVERSVRGFSLMPVLFVQLDGDPIPETAPSPASSLEPSGGVQLIEVSADGCGSRVPIEVRVNQSRDAYIAPNLLMAAPVPGFALKPATTYAYVVHRSLGAADGFSVERSEATRLALAGEHTNAALNDSFAPLRDCLEAARLCPSEVAVATVFTTQDPLTEMRALRDHVADPARTPAPTITGFGYSDNHSSAAYSTYVGFYETPIFQDGTSPYAATGGAIHFDDDGRPIVQRMEPVPFAVTAPRGDGPYKLLIWVDGTGAGQTTWVRSRVTQAMLDAGFVVASYVAQFHDNRATPGSNEEVHSFNYLNPDAFRNTFRQQVADTSYFLRVMREARDQMPGLPEIDDSRVVYGGQSQGSLIGAMVAGVEPNIEAYMLNGVGGYLAITAVERTDPFDVQALISDLAGIARDFDRFHPLMALAQLGGDASDPQSFAGEWRGWEANPSGTNVLLVNGVEDHTTPVRSMNALAISGGVAPIDEPGWNVDPFGVWDVRPEAAPIVGNREALDGTPLTHAVMLSGSTGHFTIYDRADVRVMAVEFLRSAADGAATVP